jgi:hypothetical protein
LIKYILQASKNLEIMKLIQLKKSSPSLKIRKYQDWIVLFYKSQIKKYSNILMICKRKFLQKKIKKYSISILEWVRIKFISLKCLDITIWIMVFLIILDINLRNKK